MTTFKKIIGSYVGSEKPFLIAPSGEKVLYGEVKGRTEILAEKLRSLGFISGDKVAIALPNGIQAGLLILTVFAHHGVVVPINLGWKGTEFDYILKDSESVFLISSDEVLQNAGVSYEKILDIETGISVYHPSEAPGSQSATEVEKRISLLLYTSGTTGKPKGVMLTEENLIAETGYVRDGHKLLPSENALQVLPFFHINGLVIGFLTPFVTGQTLVVPPKFSVTHFWEWIDTYEIAWVSAVPTIISMVLSRTPEDYKGGKSLRFLRSASSPLPTAVLQEFQDRFGIPIIESFGISEGASQITSNPVDGQKKPGSVGLPVGNEVQIIRDDGREAPVNQQGEVRVRGKNIFQGYYHKPEETKESLRDGWFYTGDLGYKDEDGYVYLVGRRKELINRAGEKFSPKEIDEILYQIPEIELAAAVGVPHPLYNEEVVAYVRPRKDAKLTEGEIIEFCQGKIADFKLPKKVFFIETFPLGPSGKIQRLKLIPEEPIFQ